MNQAASGAAMQQDLASGVAPFTQDAEQMGMAWTGWAWDVKFGDFLNSGNLDVVQTDGFIKGTIDRWPWLQEMAMTNDDLLSNPANWPLVEPGDDIAGHQCLAFYADAPATGSTSNISKQLGLCVADPDPGRRRSRHPRRRRAGLRGRPPVGAARLLRERVAEPRATTSACTSTGRPRTAARRARACEGLGTPAYGATVQIDTPGHTQISQLDGGSGHGGKSQLRGLLRPRQLRRPGHRAPALASTAAASCTSRPCSSPPATHDLMLTSTAQEVAEPMTATVQAGRQHAGSKQPQAARPARPSAGQTRATSRCATSRSRSRCSTSSATPLLGFEQPWLWPIFAILTGYTTEIVFEMISAWAHQRRPEFRGNGPRGLYEFLLPAHITGLAVNMLLYANNQFWPVMFGVVVAVSQKHMLQGADRRPDAPLHEPVQPRHQRSACWCSAAGSASRRRTVHRVGEHATSG